MGDGLTGGNGLRGRDLLDIADLTRSELVRILERARAFKQGADRSRPLAGRSVALILQKPSLRTRSTFEVGAYRLGGHLLTLRDEEIRLDVREPVEDVVRMLERTCSAIVARLNRHLDLVRMAEATAVPVINALTERSHPCQALADMLTIWEHRGDLDRVRLVFVGDGNNVCGSLIQAAALLGMEMTVVGPAEHHPDLEGLGVGALSRGRRPRIMVTTDLAAVDGCDVVYTDVWTSMGQEQEREARNRVFAEYRVDAAVMARCPGAVFMHDLPAHRGEEVSAEVIDGPASIVFDQAENRLWAQMALMAELI